MPIRKNKKTEPKKQAPKRARPAAARKQKPPVKRRPKANRPEDHPNYQRDLPDGFLQNVNPHQNMDH